MLFSEGINRREFLKRLGACSAVALAGIGPLAQFPDAAGAERKKDMTPKRLVFYFTATGNDLYVARQFSNEPLSIPQVIKRCGHGPMHWEAEEIGIVYPIYWQKPPVMVQEFIRKSTFTCSYFFGILTYGCNCDTAPKIFTRLCKEGGITPDYVNAIIMVDNWLPGFDMNRQVALDPSKHIEEQIEKQVADVAAHTSYIRKSVPNFEHGPTFPLEAREQFTITGDCVGCGICTKVCPWGNYRVVNGRAETSGPCEHCFACAQNCPQKAIYLTAGEANRHARYRNSHVSLQDIIDANCQL